MEQGNEEIVSDLQCQAFPKELPDVSYKSLHVNGCLTEKASSPDRETGKQLPLTQRSGPLTTSALSTHPPSHAGHTGHCLGDEGAGGMHVRAKRYPLPQRARIQTKVFVFLWGVSVGRVESFDSNMRVRFRNEKK